MNPTRKSIVLKVFQALDKNGVGELDLKEIENAYLISQSSGIQQKAKTNTSKEFLETFSLHHALTVILVQTFRIYQVLKVK